jgi:hypothetical protein
VPWSLDYQPPKAPDALDAFLAISGRALYIATCYEQKCRTLLDFVRLVEAVDGTDGNLDASIALVRGLKKLMLHGTIQELKKFPELEDADFTVLERGKDARNFVFHELCNVGPTSSSTERTLSNALMALRVHVIKLAEADNLVSGWLYEIQEKERVPNGIRAAYPAWLESWVFTGHT